MADTKNIVLTPEGRQKLVDELEYREGAKHDEIVERIKEARGFGDLSENSEYDAAKEEQSHNESRINEIRQILATATIAAIRSTIWYIQFSSETDMAIAAFSGTNINFCLICKHTYLPFKLSIKGKRGCHIS